MPLKRCTNAEGKKGWSWGNGGCQVAGSDEESKKQAIRVGLKVDGPKKFRDIMQKDKASIGDRQTQLLSQAIYNEMYPRSAADEFLHSIASFFTPARAEDGDNDSDEDLGKKDDDLDDDEDERDGEESMDGYRAKAPEDTRKFGPDGSIENPPRREQVVDKEVVKSDDEDENNESLATTELPEELSYGGLDNAVKSPGLNSVVVPYDEPQRESSPETDPSKKVPDVDPPSRTETTPSEANIYSGKDDDATEAEMEEENTTEGDAEDGDGSDKLHELAALAEYIEFAFGYIPAEVRSHIPIEDFADPEHRKYPISSEKHVMSALRLLHHSDSPTLVKRNIIKIARRKGYSLPPSITHDESCVV